VDNGVVVVVVVAVFVVAVVEFVGVVVLVVDVVEVVVPVVVEVVLVMVGRSPVTLMSSMPKPSSPASAESDSCRASVLPLPAMLALNTVALLVR
jgi:hypothetical protein